MKAKLMNGKEKLMSIKDKHSDNENDEMISFIKEENKIFSNIIKINESLLKEVNALEALYQSHSQDSICATSEDKFISLMNRTIFLNTAYSMCITKQKKAKQYIEEVLDEEKKLHSMMHQEKLQKEVINSNKMKVENDLRNITDIGLLFLDSYKDMCNDGVLFFQEKDRTEKNCVVNEKDFENKKKVVLYNNRKLKDILNDEGRRMDQVPMTIEMIINYLKSNGMVEGIFRRSSSSLVVDDMMTKLSVLDVKTVNVIDQGTLLKRFVRDIPNGLIDGKTQEAMMGIFDIKEFDDNAKAKQCVILLQATVPPENFALLKNLFSLFGVIDEHKDVTLMTAENTAICWSPILFDITVFFDKLKEINRLIAAMIKNANLFELF